MSIRPHLKRRIFAFLLCFLLVLSVSPLPHAASTPVFSDVLPTDWFYEDVMYVLEQGLMDGYPNGRFCPNDSITYVQVIKTLCRVNGFQVDDASLSETFGYAFSHGWYSLTEDLQAKAFMFAKRKVVCRILLASAGITPYAHEMFGSSCFADFSNIRNIHGVNYQDYACAGYQLGLFTGDQSGNFCPDSLITRAEFCAVLRRLLAKTDLSSYAAPVPFQNLTVMTLDEANEKDVQGIKNEIAHFPAPLIQLFNNKGWHIQVTDRHTVNAYVRSISDATGFTDHQKKVICVSSPSATSASAVIHEFGHFVKAQCKVDSHLLRKAFQTEAAQISNYATTDMGEYFAEVFRVYMSKSPTAIKILKSDCPLSYALMESCINQLIS